MGVSHVWIPYNFHGNGGQINISSLGQSELADLKRHCKTKVKTEQRYNSNGFINLTSIN